jgi:hypothetical protein
MEAHEECGHASEHEHNRNCGEIEEPDTLVVLCEQPRLKAVAGIQIIHAGFGRDFLEF